MSSPKLPNEMKIQAAKEVFIRAGAKVTEGMAFYGGRSAAFPNSKMVKKTWMLNMKKTLGMSSLAPGSSS